MADAENFVQIVLGNELEENRSLRKPQGITRDLGCIRVFFTNHGGIPMQKKYEGYRQVDRE